MESVSDFALRGSGYGYGEGSGTDYAGERGVFLGFEYSPCDGFGSGVGSGYGHDVCDGHGDGEGSGYGYDNDTLLRYLGESGGFGFGYSDFVNLKSYNGKRVYDIDSVATLIFSVHGNLAKCKTINNDLTLSDCYVAKNGNLFAHGDTAREAISALRVKLISKMDVDEKIDEFCKTFSLGVKYPTRDFYWWHHMLTGSCEYGRQKFAKEHGVDLDGEMTVREFIKLTGDSYSGDVIKKLADMYRC